MQGGKIQGNSGGKSCRITLHFPLLQLNLKIDTTSSPTRPYCIYNLLSQLLI